jgi:hypothetical protein
MKTLVAVAAMALASPYLSCTPSAPPGSTGTCTVSDALWVASDWQAASAVGSFTLGGSVSFTPPRVDLGADPQLFLSRGRAFYIAQDEDQLFELDPRCGTPLSLTKVHLASHAGTSDPSDVAVASDGSLWVPLYLAAAIAIVSPGGDVARTIDLSSYDGDGNPDASAIAIVDTPAGQKAFVVLQRLNPYPSSVQPSWMLRVDVATATVDTYVELAGRNPLLMVQDAGILWLAEPGNFDDAAEPGAGVERFDTSTSTTALVAREPDLGGSVAAVAVSGECGVAIVADATANVHATSLATFSPVTGAVTVAAAQSALATPEFDLQGLAWVGGALVVGDRRRASSGYPVHAFDARGCALAPRGDAIFLPLPPVAVRAALAP